MKRLFFSLLLFFYAIVAFSQNFEEEPLLYSDTTISKLKHIVDSLNLKYATFDVNKEYLSSFQAVAHYLYIKKGDFEKMEKDMNEGILYKDFIKKYPVENKYREENEIIVKFHNELFEGNYMITFSTLSVGQDYSIEFSPLFGYGYGDEIYLNENLENYQNEKLKKGKWIYSKNEESITAFYIVEPLEIAPIKETYAKMIQYADFMIDTTEQIFKEKIPNNDVSYSEEENSDVDIFLEYIAKQTNKPQYDDYENYENYYLEKETWDSSSIEKITLLREKDVKFDTLLKKAAKEALKRNYSDDELEFCIREYYSKEIALELKRSRRVMGQCGMDSSPRYHALSITKLSAETVKWEIFLRSHLNIIAHKFEQDSDESYKQHRKTYLKELEVLDINVLDLLLGIILKMENPSQNHYYGSLEEIGKILTETNNLDAAETKMLDMIEDNELDTYNRILIYYLFRHYNSNLEDKERQSINNEKLKKVVANLPSYISSKIIEEK